MPPLTRSNYIDAGKRCPRCETSKPASEYGVREYQKNWGRCKSCNSDVRKQMRASDTGRRRHCIVCESLDQEFYRGSNICKSCQAARDREWAQNNPGKVIAKAHRRLAMLTGTYTEAELHQHLEVFGRCLSCGSADYECDHVIPLSKGGADSLDNIQPLCPTCNRQKWTNTIDYRQLVGSTLLTP